MLLLLLLLWLWLLLLRRLLLFFLVVIFDVVAVASVLGLVRVTLDKNNDLKKVTDTFLKTISS